MNIIVDQINIHIYEYGSLLIWMFLASVGAVPSMVSSIPQAWKVRNLHLQTTFTQDHRLAYASRVGWSLYGFYLELYILGVESFIVFIINTIIIFAILRDRWRFPPIKVLV